MFQPFDKLFVILDTNFIDLFYKTFDVAHT